MRATEALVLACLLAAALPCPQSAVASPASIAGKLVMRGMELRRPIVDSVIAENRSAAEQLPTSAGDGYGGDSLNVFPLLSEMTSPLARDHPFAEQGVVLDHLLASLVVFVVYIFR
uniref:Uncharacterized protein n=1 Tax=Avena sativa TaxID=4498 RepID=A0ACD5VKC5_AVESA